MVEGVSWQVVAIIVSVLIALFAALFKLLGYFAAQIVTSVNRRFDAMQAAIEDEKIRVSGMERELLSLRAALPEQYVRREDWLRTQAVTDARYDAINARLASLQERFATPKGGDR